MFGIFHVDAIGMVLDVFVGGSNKIISISELIIIVNHHPWWVMVLPHYDLFILVSLLNRFPHYNLNTEYGDNTSQVDAKDLKFGVKEVLIE